MTSHLAYTLFTYLFFFAFFAAPVVGIMRWMDIGNPPMAGVYIGLIMFAGFLFDFLEKDMPTPNYILLYFLGAFCVFAPLCYMARHGAYALWFGWVPWFFSAAYFALATGFSANHKPWLFLVVIAVFALVFGRAIIGAFHHFTVVNQSGYESVAMSEERAAAAKAQSNRMAGDAAIAKATIARERALAEMRDAEQELKEAEQRSREKR